MKSEASPQLLTPEDSREDRETSPLQRVQSRCHYQVIRDKVVQR